MKMFSHRFGFALQLLFCIVYGKDTSTSIPDEYILNFPTGDNYLNIYVDPIPENNYFITIGDWGASRNEDWPVAHIGRKSQRDIATLLHKYVAAQAELGMNLLFIVSVGDNFYYEGLKCDDLKHQWYDVYGNLTEYIWFSMMGNHDWGSQDEISFCPYNNYHFISDNGIPYGSNQLPETKGGCSNDSATNRGNYYMPDYSYYYTINELNLELVVMEQNYRYCPDSMSFCYCCDTYQNCDKSENSEKKLEEKACDFIKKIGKASESLLEERIDESLNTNIILANHYPNSSEWMVDKWNNLRTNIDGYNVSTDEETVIGIYGHLHYQDCLRTINKTDGRVICDQVLTGGGGCCGGVEKYLGFYPMFFDENKNIIQPVDITSDLLTLLWDNNDYVNDIYTDGSNITLDDYLTQHPEVNCTSMTDCTDEDGTTTLDTSRRRASARRMRRRRRMSGVVGQFLEDFFIPEVGEIGLDGLDDLGEGTGRRMASIGSEAKTLCDKAPKEISQLGCDFFSGSVRTFTLDGINGVSFGFVVLLGLVQLSCVWIG